MQGKVSIFFAVFFIVWGCFAICDPKVPQAVKKDYATDLYNAFVLQSQGQSTGAFCSFDVGYEKAKKAGLSIQKLETLRRYFVWYRTYGYFLGIIGKPTGIVGEYKGTSNIRRQNNASSHFFKYGESPEKNAKIRDFLFGVSEIIAGTTCIYFLPTMETKLAFGAPLIYSGIERIRASVNDLWLQNDLAILELQRISQTAKEVDP